MQSVLGFIEREKSRYMQELKTFLAIPSVSTSPEHKADIARCAKWLESHLTSIGMEHTRIFPTKGHPIVYADWLHAEGKPTILIYGHYDVQPVDPIELWTSPPFQEIGRAHV
jgi:acetylornithine deacetylase/succinyl-diaminopimelate desuccinylase-like protein